MVLTLYHTPISGPSRGALLAARCVGVDIDIQTIDLLNKEQLKPDFVKINPQHTVPTLVDGDFILWDGHAIATYLVRTYAKNDSLYPTDVEKRAIVDQRLYFDCGTFCPKVRAIAFPALYLGEDTVQEEDKTALDEVFGFLDIFLEGQNFVAGDTLTVADCSLVASVSSAVGFGWKLEPFANVAAWYSRCALTIPDFESSNTKGAQEYGRLVRSKLAPGQL